MQWARATAKRIWVPLAGIVLDGVPANAYEETLNKARGLLKAIEIAERHLMGSQG